MFTCVGNDSDLRSIVLGPDGAFAGMARDTVLVDHTTASAEVARELGVKAARRRGISSTRRCLVAKRARTTAR